jgi:hypothetical protein
MELVNLFFREEQMELVNPDISVIQFGLEKSGCPQLISIKIDMTRPEELSV